MSKALLGAGLGIISLLLYLHYAGQTRSEEARQISPAMQAGLRAANTANITSLNLARTLYMQAKGQPPASLADLQGFISHVPAEAFSKSSEVKSEYDGSGGWVLDAQGFRPNHPQALNAE
jgi:hypothetical protein